MYSSWLKNTLWGFLVTATLVFGVVAFAGTTAQAQWPYGYPQGRHDRDQDGDYDRDRDRDYRRDRDRYRRGGQYGYRYAADRGYQDGLYTGERDARDNESYNPQRSHYYRKATDGYDSSYGSRDAYRHAYRDGFLRGYDDGYGRYGGRSRRGDYGRRWPFPF